MIRASYRAAVAWIADNDEAGNNDDEAAVACYVTTLLIADIFGAEPDRVARDIVRERNKKEG